MNSVRCPRAALPIPPEAQIEAAKRKMTLFCGKSALILKEVCYKFLCVKIVSDRVVTHSLAYLTVHKWLVVDVPST